MKKYIDPIEVKEALAATIDWRRSLPQFVFLDTAPRVVYFFEGPFTSRPFLLSNFAARLGAAYRTPSFFSVFHDSGVGSFDRANAAATTVIVQPDEPYEECRNRLYLDHVDQNPYTGVALGSDLQRSWYMYCDFSDEVGVLIAKTELSRSGAESEPLMTPIEFVAEYGNSDSGWDIDFVFKLARSHSRTNGTEAIDPAQ